jgi:hypothetical protein
MFSYLPNDTRRYAQIASDLQVSPKGQKRPEFDRGDFLIEKRKNSRMLIFNDLEKDRGK